MISFIGYSTRSAGITRGMQISNRMHGSEFIDANSTSISVKNRIVVFIRFFNRELARKMRSRGVKVGFDLLDVPVADLHTAFKQGKSSIDWSMYVNDQIDFYIVNNSLCREKIATLSDKPIFVIPHHHVNFSNHVNEMVNDVKVVGYVGTEDQCVRSRDIESFCTQRGIRFINTHPKTQGECQEILKQIQVGVISMDSIGYRDYVLKYKPNVKLSNFQSFGIPTVANSYESYVEFGGDAWVPVEQDCDIVDSLSNLINSYESRANIRCKSLVLRDRFDIEHIISHDYANVINTMSDNAK